LLLVTFIETKRLKKLESNQDSKNNL